jgi:hypothetical protein
VYSSPNIMQLIKSRIMRWVGHVTCSGGGGGLGGDLRHGWEGNVKCILKKVDGGNCTRLIWLRIKKSARLFLMW